MKPASKPADNTTPDNPVLRDVRLLLSGTSPKAYLSDEVEETYRLSRSQQFAAAEDIKQCECEIVHNASAPVLVEAALQNEKGSFLTDTGALSVRSGAKTGRSPKDKRVVAEPGAPRHSARDGTLHPCNRTKTRRRAARSSGPLSPFRPTRLSARPQAPRPTCGGAPSTSRCPRSRS